jgi:hypothetical protein
MKWCCIGFKSGYQAAGERAIAVLVDRDSKGAPAFLLQARAFDGVQAPEIRTEGPISLLQEARISFCPWCGVPLEKWYGGSVDTLLRPGLAIDRGFYMKCKRCAASNVVTFRKGE